MKTRMSAAKWGELVAAWETSGVSSEAFASERGVVESTLRWWKAELAKRGRNEGRQRPPRGPRRTRARAGSVPFARVVSPGEPAAPTGRVAGVAVLVGRARVVVERGFDRDLLREVVRALEEPR